MLALSNVTYAIRKKVILKTVNLEVNAGEFVAIVGPNGAGKSTLLKLISMEYPLEAGDIRWKSRSLRQFNPREMALERGVLTQKVTMNVNFPVKEVVLMGRYPHFGSMPSAQDWQIVDEAMEAAGIAHLADRSYQSLSGGEQQRTQLARAFAQIQHTPPPTLLLLDEPLNNLDVRHQHQCLNLARQHANRGNTVLLVIHDINLAALFADKILLMSGGEVVAYGAPETVLTEQNLKATYEMPVRVEQHPYHNCPVVYYGVDHAFSPTRTETIQTNEPQLI